MELNLKPVEYLGHKITIKPHVQWLAVDSDGLLHGYSEEPILAPWLKDGDKVLEWFWAIDNPQNSLLICTVDLQGTDWKDTKVKVSP